MKFNRIYYKAFLVQRAATANRLVLFSMKLQYIELKRFVQKEIFLQLPFPKKFRKISDSISADFLENICSVSHLCIQKHLLV